MHGRQREFGEIAHNLVNYHFQRLIHISLMKKSVSRVKLRIRESGDVFSLFNVWLFYITGKTSVL